MYPWLGRIGPWKRYRRLLAETDRLLYAEIAARRVDADGDDILSLLVKHSSLSDAELRDEVMTLLVAGHETTATALAWAFERLVRHPEAMERARSGDDDYLDAVIKETLRIRPVVADVVRTVTRETEVGGYTVPAGTIVLPAVALVQRSESYGDALAFRPERFLDGSPRPYSWIPFGGGVRRCIGAAFATLEMKTVLREVLGARRARASAPRRRGHAGQRRDAAARPGRRGRGHGTAVRRGPPASFCRVKQALVPAIALTLALASVPSAGAKSSGRVLATGDSMIQILDGFIKERVRPEHFRLRSDAHIGTGISKPFQLDWVTHARRLARSYRPTATVVFLGANEGFPLRWEGKRRNCCSRAWRKAYAPGRRR